MMLRLFSVLLCILVSSACTSITIDEGYVFRPTPQADMPATEADLVIAWQDVFEGQEPIEIKIEAWEQTAHIKLDKDVIAPSDVSHGFIGEGNARIAYTLITQDGAPRPLIIHCGGNTASRHENGTPYGLKLITFGDALLFDYPGYGDSPGEANTESLHQMNRSVARFAEELTKDGRPIILWGHSLGGFVCTDMVSALSRVDGLVLEASARDAAAVARSVPPWFAKPFIRINIADGLARFDNVDALNGFTEPVLVLGAKKDKTLPVRLSRRLARDLRRTGRDVTYAEFSDANHISIGTVGEFPDVIESFLERSLQ